MHSSDVTMSGYLARILFAVLLVIGLGACRGTVSQKAPLHINPNMDRQERSDPQSANSFFEDGRAMRPRVPGTVARGFLRDDVAFYYGRESNGSFVNTMPVQITREILLRGRERYNIFCSPCHGKAGDGQGIIATGNYGLVPVPTYHSDRIRGLPDGQLYDVISNGFSTMPAYGQQIPVADRWAIVAYMRALQRSQNAAEGDIPANILTDLQAGR